MTGFYAYRFEASEIFGRVTSELLPSEPQVERGGEVVVNRRLSGEFAIAGWVNNARVTFLFDTGASAVVLTPEDARRAGVETSRLVFDVPVATANGATSSAGGTSQRSWNPVRTSPGSMQEMRTSVFPSSMRKASESASMAYFVAA